MRDKQVKKESVDRKLREVSSATVERLFELLDDDALIVRVNVLNQLILHIGESPGVLPRIEAAIRSSDDKPRFFGSISLSYIGIAALLKSSNKQARELANSLVKDLSQREPELLEFLESENLSVSVEHLEAA